MNTKLIIGIIILSLLVIGIILYYLLRGARYTTILCKPTHLINKFNMFISNTKLPNSIIGNKFTYSLWIYINNLPENSEWETNVNYKKSILFRYGSPNINYYPKEHRIQVQMTYKDNLNEINYYNIDLNNLQIQYWNHLIISLDNRYIDIYINGKRYTSVFLENTPFIFNRNLYIGEKNNNFNGYLHKVKYFNYNFNEYNVKKIYESEKNSMPVIQY